MPHCLPSLALPPFLQGIHIEANKIRAKRARKNKYYLRAAKKWKWNLTGSNTEASPASSHNGDAKSTCAGGAKAGSCKRQKELSNRREAEIEKEREGVGGTAVRAGECRVEESLGHKQTQHIGIHVGAMWAVTICIALWPQGATATTTTPTRWQVEWQQEQACCVRDKPCNTQWNVSICYSRLRGKQISFLVAN